MPLKIVFLKLICFVGSHGLLFERLRVWRKQPVQTKLAALFVGERRAFVEQRRIEQIHPAWNGRRHHLDCPLCDEFCHT
jgi:hypothetical protein